MAIAPVALCPVLDRHGSPQRIVRSGHGLAGDAQGFAARCHRARTGNRPRARMVWSTGMPGHLCLVDRLRGAIRRRDIFATPSLRFADPRIGMLDGAAWEAARPTICRTLGRTPNVADEINGLSERLDAA